MTTKALSYEQRVLRRQLENADWLGSRGKEGLVKLRALVSETVANDGGMGHRMIELPREWWRGIPLHGATMNNHVDTSLRYLVEELRIPVDGRCNGNTAAQTAVIWGHTYAVAYLLARGARHDAANKEGMDLGAMARRRQALLVGGTQAERAFYARNGVPLEDLVADLASRVTG